MKNLLLLTPFILFIACETDPGSDCGGDLLCTEQLVTLGVTITENDAAVLLDEATTTFVSTGEVIRPHADIGWGDGFYIIMTDAQFDSIEQSGTEVIFRGYINGDLIVEQTYTIGHDCCHVELIDGPTEIML
ncbi:MAG: hypothetical protein JXQ90_06940 [Cyclobacteriaceae bacterium]